MRRLSSLSRFQAFLLSHQTPSYFPLPCARCSQTLSAEAAPALAGFKLLLARRKAAKRDAAHPPLLPTTRGAATKTVEALRWLTPAALVSSSADNNAHQLIVSCTYSRPLLPWELKRCGKRSARLPPPAFIGRLHMLRTPHFFNLCCFTFGRAAADESKMKS